MWTEFKRLRLCDFEHPPFLLWLGCVWQWAELSFCTGNGQPRPPQSPAALQVGSGEPKARVLTWHLSMGAWISSMKSPSGMYDPRGSESTCPGPSRFSTVVNSLERDGLRQAFFALDTQDEKDNHRLHHTGSVVARVSKDRACHRTSGWRCKMGYWWKQQTTHTIQYQHWNMERENTETTRKVGRTYSRDEKISLECPWTLWGTMEELWRNNYSGWT